MYRIPFDLLHGRPRVHCTCACCRSSEDSEDDQPIEQDGEWPTYTPEELFKQLQELYRSMGPERHNVSPTMREELKTLFCAVSNEKWIGNGEGADFKLEPNDSEVIVNFKIFMMALNTIPVLTKTLFEPYRSVVRGFFKYMYCLDPTFGTSMLCVIGRGSVNLISENDFDFELKQSMKVPDWKLSLYLSLIKLAQRVSGLDKYFYVRHFYFVIAAYYNSTKWEGLYIEMTNMDYDLLDNILKIDIEFHKYTFMALISKIAYLHLESNNSNLPSLENVLQNCVVHHINTYINYDIQVIERESIKVIPQVLKNNRIRKVLALFKILAKRNDHGSNSLDAIAQMMIKVVRNADEDIMMECLKILGSKELPRLGRCKEIMKAIMPIMDSDSTELREEAYKCGSKHLDEGFDWDEQIMYRILSSYSINPKPGANYLRIFTSALKHFCTQVKFTEKALEIVQRVAECCSNEDGYFLQTADVIASLLHIRSLPTLFIDAIIPSLDVLILRAISNNSNTSEEIMMHVQKLVDIIATLLTPEKLQQDKKDTDTELDNLLKKLHIAEMIRFLVERGKDLYSNIAGIVLVSPYFRTHVKIHPDISNAELIAKSLINSKEIDQHLMLGKILNKHFIETGQLLLQQSEVEKLINEKLDCPSIHETDNQKLVYSIAHFGDFELIAEKMGINRCCASFLYHEDVTDIMLSNYLRILEHNLFIRPKQLDLDEIYDTFSDCVTPGEFHSLFVNSSLQRVSQLLEIHVRAMDTSVDSESTDDGIPFNPYMIFPSDSDDFDSDEDSSDFDLDALEEDSDDSDDSEMEE